jgi:hypothetical protein
MIQIFKRLPNHQVVKLSPILLIIFKFDHKCLFLYTIRLQIDRSFRIYECICTCMHIKKNIDVFLLKNIFKYNSGRVSITLQKKKKFCPEGVRHEKKSISKTPCLLY